MKLISISTDKKIFEEGSSVQERMKEYGSLFNEFHIVVFSLKKHKFKKVQISDNTWIYPTQSFCKLMYVFNAKKIASSILAQKTSGDWVVTTQDPFETGLVGVSLKKKYGVQLNVQVHTDMYSPYFKTVNVINGVRLAIAPKVFNESDSIRVVSNRIKNSLIEKGVEVQKIKVLPVFVDKNQYSFFYDIVQQEKILIAVSRLSKEKNIFFLIDVVSDVIDFDPEVKLIIVGEGSLRNDLKNYVKEKKLENNIEFVGWSNDVAKWFSKAGVFVHTSLFEGYGMVFVEAALQHVPMVSSDVGIMNDIFVDGESAKVCSVNDRNCFVESLKSILQDRGLAQKISSKAYDEIIDYLPIDKQTYLESFSNIFSNKN